MENLFPTVWATLVDAFQGYALGMWGFWGWLNEPIQPFGIAPIMLFSVSGMVILLAFKFARMILL